MKKKAKELQLEDLAVVPITEKAVATVAPTPLAMIQIAVQDGRDLDYIAKLMEMEREWKADQAREAYYVALAEFKKQPIIVTKDKKNEQYGSMYTSIGNLVNTVNAAMAPFGLNAKWEIDQSESITVTCILSHTLGHREKVSMSGPPDESGSKNKLQQIKSTVTYLELSTFQAVTGVVSQDGNTDDDGNASGNTISENQVKDLEALITEVSADRAAFLKYCKLEKLEDMKPKNYQTAINALQQKRG